MARVRRLKEKAYQPEAFLFPVRMPAQDKKTRYAADAACAELQDLGVEIVLFGEVDRILAFAEAV